MKMHSTLLALAIHAGAAASPATDRFLAADGIVVGSAPAVPATVDDAGWASAMATSVVVAPQSTVTLNDKGANAFRQSPAPGNVVVRAIASPTELGVLLEWDDATENRFVGETDSYGDSAAIEMPVAFGAGQRLPYIGMGDAGSHVVVHMVRAMDQGKVTTRHAVAAGFGSLTAAPLGWMKTGMAWQPKTKRWRALFVRPLKAPEHSVDAAIVPIAFALWDGARDQRGGNKVLSAWHVLRLPGRAPDATYVAELAFGYGDGDVGDAARGQAMVEAICLSCHRIGAKGYSPPDLAPELTNVGVLSSYSYLRDSVMTPSAALVPNLNVNRHQDRTKPKDDNGAHAHGSLGAFAVNDGSGTAQSVMPGFGAMPKEQVADIVAYLKTLGRAPSSPPSPGATP
jgi:complex iron-sulfur molybdoenzyme family reductase subunit gamma